MHIGEKIRQIRRQKDLSQAWLAEQIGVVVSYVSMIENGKSDPDSELIKKFAHALSVSPSIFFEDETEPKPKARVHFGMPGHLTEDEQEKIIELVEKLGNAQSNDRDLVLQLVDKILRK
jgi:transcriptional regulator with XRE-family HTH domain